MRTPGSLAVVLLLTACGAPSRDLPPPAAPAASTSATVPAPKPDAFRAALAELAAHDATDDWTDAACTALATRFATAIDPPPAPALHNAAVAEARCGHDSAALDYARRAAAADPDSAPPRLLLAHLEAARAAAQRDFAGARAIVTAAIRRDGPTDELVADLALIHVAQVLASPRPESAAFDLARKACDEAIARAPTSVRLLVARSALAAKERRFADARADIDRALALHPSDRSLRLDAAALASAVRDFDAADRTYLALLQKSASDVDVRLARAIALRGKLQTASDADFDERYAAARDAISSVITLAPDRPDGHLHYAVLLLDYGWRSSALRGGSPALLAFQAVTRALELSRDRPEHAEVERRAQPIYKDLHDMLTCSFPRQTEADRKREEAEAKQRAAEEEAKEPSP